ncbi:hypothetical protein CEE86_14650, partial [Lactobacillus crispatus]
HGDDNLVFDEQHLGAGEGELGRLRTVPVRCVATSRRGEILLTGNAQPANQSVDSPIEVGLALQLGLDAGDHAARPEPAGCGLGDRWATGFLPGQAEIVAVDAPADVDMAIMHRERTVFSRVGGQFVDRQRQRLGDGRLQHDRG